MLLQPALRDDIPAICAIESLYPAYITVQPAEQHLAALDDPNTAYLVARDAVGNVAGYVIMAGRRSPHRIVELRRIAVRNPGERLGRPMLLEAMRRAFHEFGAHRLWLDVAIENERAQALYRSVGFRQEGILREAHYHNGSYSSLLLMSMLEQEYKELESKEQT
ncbi:GNAT family N-acetyltransferase [Terriglobus albidus]|uniref:GNAT family N-acetyltransferase n=1 Tax=Terriglobus albidus TaxID=1592106 RepID=UPI0021E021BD|nr:GNAT family N-acetyltransferase [Terriglobus albidus]